MKLRKTFVLLLTFIAVPICAQDRLSTANPSSEKTHTEAAEYDFKRGTNEFGFWLGLAPNATTQLGGLRDAQARGLRLALISLHYGIIVASTKRFAFEYTLDVIPAAALLGAYVRCPDPMNPNCNLSPHTADTRVRKTAYAFGVAPVGFKFNLMPRHRLQPFVSLAGGFLRFNREVPLPRATKFNFTAELGGGLQILNRSGRAVMLGYKVHHLSNGGLGKTNPGLNSNIFYVGYSILKKPAE